MRMASLLLGVSENPRTTDSTLNGKATATQTFTLISRYPTQCGCSRRVPYWPQNGRNNMETQVLYKGSLQLPDHHHHQPLHPGPNTK